MGYVVGVFSAKGGVGKSLLATNLGVSMGVGHKRRTVLIDLNPRLGTADLLLDLEPERSWADLLPVASEMTPQHLQLAVTEYEQGLDFLACPLEWGEDRIIKQEDVKSILAAFRKEYEVVLLDTCSGGGKVNLAAYTLSDMRLVVLTPDAPALRSTSRFLASLPKNEKDCFGGQSIQLRSGASTGRN
jgi:pilus assembly protein CpaE